MTTRKSRRWPSNLLSVAVAALYAGGMSGGVAAAAPAAVGGETADVGTELYLDVELNGVASGRLVRFVEWRGALHADAADLRELGLRWPGGEAGAGMLPLDRLPGLQVRYDAARQRVALVAPVDLLDRPLLAIGAEDGEGEGGRPRVDPATLVPGLLLNYDLYGQRTADQHSIGVVTELRVFGAGPGSYSNTMASRTDGGHAQSGDRFRNVRLDSSWQRDFPELPMSLTLGDSATGGLAWSRGLRIGGVRLASNFGLQPYRVTAPLAAFQGSAVLPSTVDLFINGIKQSSQQVPPGQFQLSSVPSLNGAGQAQMVITDVNGQSRTISFDLYGTSQLLQAGLTDWSLEAGLVRRDYGLRSFAYASEPVVSASARHGLDDALTLEAHAETTRGLGQAGVGGVLLLGRQAGIVNASLAASRHAGEGGRQWGLGYQWSSRVFNASFNSLRASDGYRDVASRYGAAVTRLGDSVFTGVSSPWGQFGLGWLRQQSDGAPNRFVTLSWSRQFSREVSMSLSLNRSLDSELGPTLYFSLSMPLSDDVSAAASLRKSRGSRNLSVDARSPPSPDEGGWGWRLQAGRGESTDAQGEVSHVGRYGEWSAGIGHYGAVQGAPATRSVYASASGGVVLMQGGIQPMRRVDDAFAVVSTNGVEGVPVRLENRLIGSTDGLGLLFVTRLNAWERNRLSIDTEALPADMRVGRDRIDAVPPARSGMLAQFDLRRVLALQVGLRDANGETLAAGSPVWVESPGAAAADGAPVTAVGYDGLVYIEDPARGAVLRVRTASGICRAPLPPPAQDHGVVDLGTVSCR